MNIPSIAPSFIPSLRKPSRVAILSAGVALFVVVAGTVLIWGRSYSPSSRVTTMPELSGLPGQSATDDTLHQLALEEARMKAQQAEQQRGAHITSLNTASNIPRSPTLPAPVPTTRASPTGQVFLAPSVTTVPNPTLPTKESSQLDDRDVAKYAGVFAILAANMSPRASAMGVEQTPEAIAKKLEDARKERESRVAAAQTAQAGSGGGGRSGSAVVPHTLVMPAMRWAMGQTVLATDTDGAGGLVIVDITSGPLNGARLRGIAQRRVERMAVSLTEMSWNGKSIPVDAVLISPETKESAVASSVDHHYGARLLYPSLAALASGAGQAVALSGSTQVNSAYGNSSSYRSFDAGQIATVGLGAAGNNLQQVLNEMAPKGPTVRLDAGVPVGVMFLKDVTDTP